MVYRPSKNPTKAFLFVSGTCIVGIGAGYYISHFFMVVALILWMQYTAILSYMQFSKKRKYKRKNFTEQLLNPQIRFFLFEFIATLGLLSIFYLNTLLIGILALFAWWLFALNFFTYYKRRKKILNEIRKSKYSKLKNKTKKKTTKK